MPSYDNNSQYNNRRPNNRKRLYQRKRVCRFCTDPDVSIDYKLPKILRYFVTERGRIIPRRVSGACAKHQRKITREIKRARMMALMPYIGSIN